MDGLEYRDSGLYWTETRGQRRKGARFGSTNTDGYRRGKFNRRNVFEHVLIWELHHGYTPKQVDHINRIPDDNRIENLREVCGSTNCMNKARTDSPDTGIRTTRHGRFSVHVGNNYIGCYPTREEARDARRSGVASYRKELAARKEGAHTA